jgi:glucose/arabinose dehydrogenase
MPTFTGTAIDAQLVAVGLRGGPVHVHAPPLDPSRLFIVERTGYILLLKNGTLPLTTFLDIDAKVGSDFSEQGLLSMAFHPDYEHNGRFFVNYTNNSGDSVIARYQVSANADVADRNSEKILRIIDRPADNHNGGQLAFAPDGSLYFGMGDSGGGGDPAEAAQSEESLLGKLLRFDVDVETPPYYVVPASNPNAAAGDPLGLLWAKGLRNPWRFSFDRANGDLYIGDVGQGEKEEIDYQPAASSTLINYGWDVYEGTSCFEPSPTPCPTPPPGFTSPVHEYSHAAGCSVTGGFVYRGCALPALRGRYFYADFCTNFIRTFRLVNGVAQDHQDHAADLALPGVPAINSISSFGEDARGELYITDLSGEVFKIVPQASPTPTVTPSPSRTRTSTRTASFTPSPTRTPTATFTPSHTRTPTPLRTHTRTWTATRTPTHTATARATASPTATRTHSPTRTPTPTHSQTATRTSSATPTFSSTLPPTSTRTPTTTASATASPSPSNTPPASATATQPAIPTPSATPPPTPTATVPPPTFTPTGGTVGCTGDCDGFGTVTVSEVIRAVRIVLGELPAAECPAFGGSTPGVEDLLSAVTNALNGCGG